MPSVKPLLIATVGFPRSGKSTWAKEQGHPVVNPDSIRLALHGQRFVAEAEPFVWAIAKVMVRALFIVGHPVVVLDATNVTKKRRDEWKSDEWRTQFHVVDTPAEVCRQRALYQPELLPVIDRMSAEYEPLDATEVTY